MVGVWGRESTELMPVTRTLHVVSCVAHCVVRAKACTIGRCWARRCTGGRELQTVESFKTGGQALRRSSASDTYRFYVALRRELSRAYVHRVPFGRYAPVCGEGCRDPQSPQTSSFLAHNTRAVPPNSLGCPYSFRESSVSRPSLPPLTSTSAPRASFTFVSPHFDQHENHRAHPPPGLVFHHRRSGQVLGVLRAPVVVRLPTSEHCRFIVNLTLEPNTVYRVPKTLNPKP